MRPAFELRSGSCALPWRNMHSTTLQRLKLIADRAKIDGRPQSFLERLGPILAAWHATANRNVGFLLLHWHVCDWFRKLGLDRELGVIPLTPADFNAGGQFAS